MSNGTLFILAVEKKILGSDGAWYALAVHVLPFPPYDGLVLCRPPAMEIELHFIIWDMVLGCFRAGIEPIICHKDELAETVASDFVDGGQWGTMCREEDLDDVRAAHVKQAISELQQTLLKQQPRIVTPGGRRRG